MEGGSIFRKCAILEVYKPFALPWIAFVGLLSLMMLYFVGAEQGATSLVQGNTVHEFVHDGRHVLGFPCH